MPKPIIATSAGVGADERTFNDTRTPAVNRLPLVLMLCALPLVASAQSPARAAGPRSDASAFHGDASTLIQAIQAIEQASGARVLDIRFSASRTQSGFDSV